MSQITVKFNIQGKDVLLLWKKLFKTKGKYQESREQRVEYNERWKL